MTRAQVNETFDVVWNGGINRQSQGERLSYTQTELDYHQSVVKTKRGGIQLLASRAWLRARRLPHAPPLPFKKRSNSKSVIITPADETT